MQRKWLGLLAVSLGTFVSYLDNNIVNVALPTIQRDLGLTLGGLEWIVSGYVLVFAALLLTGGRLADLFGARLVFMAGLGVFTLASLAAGLAGDAGWLIAARALQGVGAAMLTPTALSQLPAIFPDPRERATAVGIWGATGALAMALGPFAGGLISENLHWGWIFLINVPIGVATLALAARVLPAPARRVRRRLDLPGMLTSSAALASLTYALIEGGTRGWTSPEILGAFAVAAVAAVAFALAERRTADPMIDLSLFRRRAFGGGTLTMGLWSFGVFGIYFFTAIYVQNVLGFTPIQAGAAFVPMAVVMAGVAVAAPALARRYGTAGVVAAGVALMAVSIFAISFAGATAGYGDLLPWFLVYGLGAGLLIPVTNTIVGALPQDRAGAAAGVLNVSREIFGLLGVTVLGAIVSARQSAFPVPGLPAFLDGYQFALIIAAAIVALGIPVSLLTLRRTDTRPPRPADPASARAPEPAA
ncbi:DHA2 family efflux MFS transporter permease subunit [Bailinhaonella thermotolerans]|uniref:DHA2 family efflux MFS transporter permease subunit n=1 Tax=Bailinhaonella thermotolerans TaxID=1070861 RepID=A0A3A4AWJ9_9ACTN|nr:DHA2 family efflux MFS transporter permease subunit [Bailinhaonella thermotolerans]RJL31744.1 DHA2 family efflux MFS transporter permease subunit [Bailinhaonella thermotolerans]